MIGDLWDHFSESVLVKCFSDPVFSVYLWSAIVCTYGVFLFAGWWVKIGRARETYMYLTFMFGTLSWVSWNGCFIRWMYVVKTFKEYNAYITSIWWSLPMMLTITIFTVIVSRMNYRMWKEYKPWSLFKMKVMELIVRILKNRR
jgi:hypothetical protein